MAEKLRITQVRSTIKRLENQKRTIRALGLRHVYHTVVHADSPTIRGMLNTVSHLVVVERFEE